MTKLAKIIFWLFAALLFFVPLVLWPFTSEVFEFNKMVLVYILTVLITAAWVSRSIVEKRIIFRRTILDVPLLIFLGSQFISTVLSIDPATSWLGYYSRFNGGFLSVASYSLLYWAFVSNFGRDEVSRLLNYSILPGAALVCLYGAAEHLGIDKNLWVQDVQSRVFSTLGQPNWLAAFIVALIPITWALALESGTANLELNLKSKKFLTYFSLSVLFFWTLIFTKSRSGLLGFLLAFIIFWGLFLWNKRKEYKKHVSTFAIICFSLLFVGLISGSQFTPSLGQLMQAGQPRLEAATGPALETGGTESGTIRKIVWRGAFNIWANYPVFGTGVETFAYSYYLYRPKEHNLVSEWDFIYNKAHNEFLNIAANSGTVGLLSYLVLIGFSVYLIVKPKAEGSEPLSNLTLVQTSLVAGYVSLLITNFFGFSVVPTQLQLFLFPALAITLFLENETQNSRKQALGGGEKVAIFITACISVYLISRVVSYWRADTLYSLGKNNNSAGNYSLGASYLTKAISLTPNQALFHNDLASSYINLALAEEGKKNADESRRLAGLAVSESDKAIALSPSNLNLKRTRFGIFITLSTIDPNYLAGARDILIAAIKQAPTDAKLYYNLGLTYIRTGEPDLAAPTLAKTIELKENYRDARLAYAYLLTDQGKKDEARLQLEYILKNIDPNDSLTKQALEEIR